MNISSTSLPSDTDLQIDFPTWVTSVPVSATPLVLEIGAGAGMFGYPDRIKQKLTGAKLIGIDPDPVIHSNPYLDEGHIATAEQFAAQDKRQFDCVYSMFVVEHVSDPTDFMVACRKLIKAGGSFFAMTCNYWHYFGMLATLTDKIGLQDRLLARLRGEQLVESYHFKTEYKLNDLHSIARACEQAGFSSVELRYFDPPQRFAAYLPRGFKWWAHAWSKATYSLQQPHYMGMLMFRCQTA